MFAALSCGSTVRATAVKEPVLFSTASADQAGSADSTPVEVAGLPANADAKAEAVKRADGSGIVHIPFSSLGAYRTLNLRGLEDIRSVNVGVRLDRKVKSAHLRLTYSYSPALLFSMSHLKVSINDEVITTLAFNAEHAGRPVTQVIDIDPRLLTDYSQLQLRLIAHYSLDHCEDPSNSALWADVSPSSEIVLDEEPIPLPNELSLLPAPFFDSHDVDPLRLPFVLAQTASNETLRAAGIVASWFGVLADYRRASFPVSSALPSDASAVIVGRADELPRGLLAVKIDGPALLVMDNPAAPMRKLLIVTGKSAEDVDSAVYALVLKKPGVSGSLARLSHVEPDAVRKPYDAPRWIPVDRPVRFTELTDHPNQLQTVGGTPETIELDLRVPADLVSWNDVGVPVDLRYRYTAPSVQNNSALSIEMNQQMINSYRLTPADTRGGMLATGDSADAAQRSTTEFEIPSFLIGSTNRLGIRFNLDSQKSTLCSGASSNPARAAVDSDSSVDFSHFVHYAAMPNLAFFSGSGFPYTRLADLSQTVVVVRAKPAPQELEALLIMLGHMGKWTGYPALRVTIARPNELVQSPARYADKDVLLIGGSLSAPLVADWGTSVPLIAGAATGGMRRAALARNEGMRPPAAGTPLTLSQASPLAAIYGFQSPVKTGRTAIALVSSDAKSMRILLDAFDTPRLSAQIHGDVVVVRSGSVQSAQIGEPYFVGRIPWHARILGLATRHPVLLGLISVLAGLLLATGVFNFLHRLAERRQEV